MKSQSYRNLLSDWERLLAAVRSSEAELPVLTAYRLALENHYETVKAARARQLSLQEDSQQATRELRTQIRVGGDEASRLRSQVKALLGPRDPRLRLFGISPLPLKKSRKKPPCCPRPAEP